MEAALSREREARRRLESATDSAAAASRAAAARADSMAALAARNVAEAERRREAARATLDAFESELRALVDVLPAVQSVRRTLRGIEIVLGGSLFPSGATSLGPEARPHVERVARTIVDGPPAGLAVTGHTDATGSAAANLAVSRLRAQAVRQVLVEVGIAPTSVEVIAAGEDSPIAPNETPDGRSRNRRVEILVLTGTPPGG